MSQKKAGKFIAVANMKGGVGKTTTVVSLAETLAADDLTARVLVVDLDPQASASLCIAGDTMLANLITTGRTLQDLLEFRLLDKDKKRPVSAFIRHQCSSTLHRGEQLDIALMPCGPGLRLLERRILYELIQQHYSMNALEGHVAKFFNQDFAPLRREYDYVIFDCPPGISPFTEVTIKASDLIIVPTIPDKISNFGLNAFCNSLWPEGSDGSTRPPKPYVLATRVMEQVTQHKMMLARFEAEAAAPDAAYHLLQTRIPSAAALAAALVRDGYPTYQQKYGPAIVQTLAELTSEIKGIV